MSDITATLEASVRESIIRHLEAAVAFERNREPVHRVDSSRPSTRPECLLCGFGIRKETTPVNGMHPMCARVDADPREALTKPINGIAARALLDRLYVARRRSETDIARDAARATAHRELLARFEVAEAARDEAARDEAAAKAPKAEKTA